MWVELAAGRISILTVGAGRGELLLMKLVSLSQYFLECRINETYSQGSL